MNSRISTPKVFTTTSEIRAWRRSTSGKVGFVPTMGALHEGHATLLRKVRSQCDISVLSIFVNPTQFGPNEDLAKYPRTLERDLEIAAQEKVDIVFAPTPAEIYPQGYSTFVEETVLSLPLCGVFRPGHFKGVTTVVLKLLNLVQPQLSLFGLKDAQQFFVLNKMIQDLNIDTAIEGISTVRESDGLALSSRNAYLSTENREKAPLIYQVLNQLKETVLKMEIQDSQTAQNAADFLNSALARARQKLESEGFKIQYLECLELPQLSKTAESLTDKPLLIAVAAFLGTTRLIDNVMIRSENLSNLGVRIDHTTHNCDIVR